MGNIICQITELTPVLDENIEGFKIMVFISIFSIFPCCSLHYIQMWYMEICVLFCGLRGWLRYTKFIKFCYTCETSTKYFKWFYTFENFYIIYDTRLYLVQYSIPPIRMLQVRTGYKIKKYHTLCNVIILCLNFLCVI